MNRTFHNMNEMPPLRKVGLLTLIAALLWGAQSFFAFSLAGADGLEGAAYASFICLLPGWLVVYVTSRYPDAGSQASAVLLGTGLRMAFVLVGAVVLIKTRPEWGLLEFYVWLLIDYLVFLALETLMLVPSESDAYKTSQPTPNH